MSSKGDHWRWGRWGYGEGYRAALNEVLSMLDDYDWLDDCLSWDPSQGRAAESAVEKMADRIRAMLEDE